MSYRGGRGCGPTKQPLFGPGWAVPAVCFSNITEIGLGSVKYGARFYGHAQVDPRHTSKQTLTYRCRIEGAEAVGRLSSLSLVQAAVPAVSFSNKYSKFDWDRSKRERGGDVGKADARAIFLLFPQWLVGGAKWGRMAKATRCRNPKRHHKR